jgi:hypothetical protein
MRSPLHLTACCDPSTTLRTIWSDQLRHYAAAWSIAAAQRRRGTQTSGLLTMARDWFTQLRLMASYPPTTERRAPGIG